MVYIGLNDEDFEGNLMWSNGDPFSYNNINPCSFCNENSENMDYVIMHSWNGTWSWSNLYNQRRYIIEVPCSSDNQANISLLSTSSKGNEKLMLEKVVPNPVENFIYLKINSPQEMEGEIHIYDARGVLVKNQHTSFYLGIQTIEIDISEFNAGMFFNKPPRSKLTGYCTLKALLGS